MNAAGSAARNGTPRRVIIMTHTYPPSIANAPCARLTKFIRPSVTDSPTAMMKSRLPYASPSNSTPMTLPITAARERRPALLARVLDVGDLVELDVGELAVLLLDLADVHGLRDVARVGVDRHRPARARPLHPLDHRHRLVAVYAATELLGNFVDD